MDEGLAAFAESLLMPFAAAVELVEGRERPTRRRKPPAFHPKLRGQIVEVVTPLKSSGTIKFFGKLYSAKVAFGYIDAGEKVSIVGSDGFELVVEPAEK